MLADDEDGSTDRNEDLAHDDVPDVLVWTAEVDHQSLCEDVERDCYVEKPFKVARLADHETDA